MRRAYVAAAAVLFALFAYQLVLHATRASTTIDEPTHILAGFRHLRCGDFRINVEHPPLLKVVAAMPLMAMHLRDPLGPCTPARDTPPAAAFAIGGDFLAANGIDPVVVPARLAACAFSLLLAVVVFAGALRMFGPAEALIALAVLTFEPTLIAHGSLVTNDMAVTALLFATFLALQRYLETPTAAWFAVTAIAAGLTLSAKHSGIFVLGMLLFLGRRRIGAAAAMCVVAVAVLCATYGFHPQPYLDGFRLLLTNGERAVYLFGRAYPAGRWYYFPLLLSIKASLALLVMLPFAFRCRRPLLLLPPLAILALAMTARLNIGVRHVLPLWPFLIVAGAGGAWAFARTRPAAKAALAALLLFHAGNTIVTAPDYLAFANPLWGGTDHTWRIVKDSNVEWGQNVKVVHDFVSGQAGGPCWFASYGHGALSRAQQPCTLLPALGWNAGRELVVPIPPLVRGTVFLSVTALPPRGGPEYAPILASRPLALLGGSVFVYRGTFRVPLLAALTHATLAQQLAQRGRGEEAAREAETARALAPDDPRVRAVHARVTRR